MHSATLILLCAITSPRFDDRFGRPVFGNHKMYLGGNTYGFGYGPGGSDLNGKIPMMGNGSSMWLRNCHH
ncbi:MAG: hypothetical protein WDO06_02410 [Actinomycetota bacterium]